jgi:hypothetical protein
VDTPKRHLSIKVIASSTAMGVLAFLLVSAYAMTRGVVTPIEYVTSSILLVALSVAYVAAEQRAERSWHGIDG